MDCQPARPRGQPVAIRPSPEPGTVLTALDGYERVRVSGSTAVDLCRVTDGSAGAFVDTHRGVVHVHDLAGPLALLSEAGAGVARPDGDLVLVPDPTRCYRVVAAYGEREAAPRPPLRSGEKTATGQHSSRSRTAGSVRVLIATKRPLTFVYASGQTHRRTSIHAGR